MEKMSKKDFMDKVLGEMAEEKKTAAPKVDKEDAILEIKVSTGEVYAINTETFNWQEAISNLPSMLANMDTVRTMVRSILFITDPKEKEADEALDKIIEQLTSYMSQQNINPCYDAIDENLKKDKVKYALTLCYDSQAIMNTLYNATTMYSVLEMLTMGNPESFKPSEEDFDKMFGSSPAATPTEETKSDIMDEPSEKKSYIVEGVKAASDVNITSIMEDDDCPPDEYYVPFYKEDDTFFVHVFAKSTMEAKNIVRELVTPPDASLEAMFKILTECGETEDGGEVND